MPDSVHPSLPRAQILTERTFATLNRFLHIEALSGIVLLLAAGIALVWANSPAAQSYHDLWHAPVVFGFGSNILSTSLHFVINDGLMTLFFLVVGMEIRREIHEGALRDVRQAVLPVAAAMGGVMVPALIFFALNPSAPQVDGWAIPAATDIAFAVGVLALLGKWIPGNVRVFLLTLAIIDDIVAVLIIAFFYSGGLDPSGFVIAGLGIAMVLAFQRMGIGTAYGYVLPGAILWVGLLVLDVHPSLAGVILGFMTPVISRRMLENPLTIVSRIASELSREGLSAAPRMGSLVEMRKAQREVLPPVVRIQAELHPWVAYGVMPIFALANAGVSIGGVDLTQSGPQWVMLGVAMALVGGKLLGVLGVSFAMVKLGLSRLPQGVDWGGICLIGLLAGIGFTMSIFIATLAYESPALLSAAKLGVLLGSAVAATLGLSWGLVYTRRLRLRARLGV